MQPMENKTNWMFDLWKFSICNQVFHNKLLLNALCAFLSNFLFSWSMSTYYSIYLIMCKICDKNISYKKYKNWEIFYLKWGIESSCSWKRALLCFHKRAPLTKRHLDYPEGQVKVKSCLPKWKLFLKVFISIKKKFFFQKGYFLMNCPIPDTLSFYFFNWD